MKQAIAGVAPAELEEVTQMDVWPSISANPAGRLLGRAYAWSWPDVYLFRVGNLAALVTIPVALVLYFYRLLPSLVGLPLHGYWYRLTNRGVIVLRNEVNMGRGQSILRTVAGVLTLLLFGGLFLLLFLLVYRSTFPAGFLGWLPLLICIAGMLAGLVPLFFDVPMPRFKYAVPTRSIALDAFDDVQVSVRPGQAWFAAGDLIFRHDGLECFRLEGVPRPAIFRQVLLKARMSHVGVKKALQAAAPPVPA